MSHDDIVKRVRAKTESFMPPLHKNAFLLTDGNGITHSSLHYDVELRVAVGSQEMLVLSTPASALAPHPTTELSGRWGESLCLSLNVSSTL